MFEYFGVAPFADAFDRKNISPIKVELLGSNKIFEIMLSFQTRYQIIIAMFRDVTSEESKGGKN